MIQLKIGGVPEHFNLPWRLAIEEGKLREIGIDVHWSDMSGGTGQMIRGLESGSIDVAVLLTEGITKSILQGLDAKILKVYVASPLHWGIHVPFHSDIHKVAQLENQTFAISREGSGSHLMALVLAGQKLWNPKQLKFNVIGDVYGGLWALKSNEAQAFLWEKYTTHPFVEQEKCRYIDEVVTPWPCFVIAVRTSVLAKYPAILEEMSTVVAQRAKAVKIDSISTEMLAWRYNLKQDEVAKWLNETEWNYNDDNFDSEFEKVVQNLRAVGLVSDAEAENWQEKLF
ncbi:MAG: ABC transporter substrate-binding protein [Bacteroidota bacterium]